MNFPWGSLLSVVAGGDVTSLNNIRRLCSPGALLKVIVALDLERDRSEIERLGVPALSADYLDLTLVETYRTAGFEIVKCEALRDLDWSKLGTSWAKRLRGNSKRSAIRIMARAQENG